MNNKKVFIFTHLAVFIAGGIISWLLFSWPWGEYDLSKEYPHLNHVDGVYTVHFQTDSNFLLYKGEEKIEDKEILDYIYDHIFTFLLATEKQKEFYSKKITGREPFYMNFSNGYMIQPLDYDEFKNLIPDNKG